MSSFRRRLMMAAFAGGGGGGGDYIQDGLVFWLDGINKGSITDAWENLVGNHSYYPFENKVTIETNAVVTNGQDILFPSASQGISGLSGTIEVCAQYISDSNGGGYGLIINGYGNNSLMLARRQNAGLTFMVGSTGNTHLFSNADFFTPFTASLSANTGILNGNGSTGVSADSWAYPYAVGETIGGRQNDLTTKNYMPIVRIFSIRMYNRQLTQAEMLSNQRIDNQRFNLGLNI